MRRGAVLVALGITLLVSAEAREARAQEPAVGPSAGERVRRRAVGLTIAGPSEEARLLEDTIRELLGRLGLFVMDASRTTESSLLARVDVDLGSGAVARIVITDGRDGRVLVQRGIARDPSTAITREEVAHAVRAAIDSELLADEDRPPAPPAPTPPAPAPFPPDAALPADAAAPPEALVAPGPAEVGREAPREAPRAPVGYGLDLATFAAAGPVGNENPFVPRIGLAATLGSRVGFRPSLSLSTSFAVPFETATTSVESHAKLVSGRVVPSVEVLRSSWAALEVGVGGGVDVVTVQPRSAVLPSSTLGSSTTHLDPLLVAGVTARFSLVSSVVLTMGVTADVDLLTRRYVVDEGSQQSDVFAPWRVRPALVVGFAFTALGDAPFGRGGPP